MITRRTTLKHTLAAAILVTGLATAASAQYGEMLKQAGKDEAKKAAADAMPAEAGAAGAAAGAIDGNLIDGNLKDKAGEAAAAGSKKAIDAKVGGKDMKGAAMDGGQEAVGTLQGKGAAAVPAVPAVPAAIPGE